MSSQVGRHGDRCGWVAPGTAYDPDDIAEHYWRLSRQPRSEWQTRITHG
jgi:hypothetical protein